MINVSMMVIKTLKIDSRGIYEHILFLFIFLFKNATNNNEIQNIKMNSETDSPVFIKALLETLDALVSSFSS